MLIVFFSEKGFCATYNNQLLPLLSRIKDDYTIILVGTEGKQILSNLGCKWDFFSPSCRQLPDEEDGCDVFEYLKVLQFPQTVKILVNQYVSMFQQKPVIVDLIPELKDIYTSAYMEEDLPKVQIDAHIMESFIKYRLNYFYIENFLGEMSSKFMIMRSASDNAKKVKDNVVKELHKLKQQKMTQELSEIITSYRLLKSERNKNGKRR